MAEITAYHNATAPVYRQWIAYVVLSDGKLWGVYAIGATEEAARVKISMLWESERAKVIVGDPWANINQASEGRAVRARMAKTDNGWKDIKGRVIDPDKQHHRAGKIWMRHKETRELVSIPLTEITMYEGKGYERSGPRSK